MELKHPISPQEGKSGKKNKAGETNKKQILNINTYVNVYINPLICQ